MSTKETIQGFPRQLLSLLLCPSCHNGSLVSKTDQQLFVDASVQCNACTATYPIENGILNVLSKQEDDLSETMHQEIQQRDILASQYDDRLAPRFFKEVAPTLDRIGSVEGKKIIEYGCGTGRLTTHLAERAAAVLAIDFSRASLEHLGTKLNAKTPVGRVLADATQVQTQENQFDLAISGQLLEHIPTLEQREHLYMHAHHSLRAGGRFVATAYHFDRRRRRAKQPQEGQHRNGIFYHFFTERELRAEVGYQFGSAVTQLLDCTLPLETRLRLPARVGGLLSRCCSRLPWMRQLGHIVLVEAKKNSSHRVGSYQYPARFFHKQWHWFCLPSPKPQADMEHFFSYQDATANDCKKKKGLTTIIDLTKSVDDLWESMRKSFVRKQITRGGKQGIVVRHDSNFESFAGVDALHRKEKGLAAETISLFEKNGLLFSAYYKDQMIAGGVFVAHKPQMRAWVLSSQRFTDNSKMRDIVGQANRMVIWEAIQYAKRNGYTELDLGGIVPDSPDAGRRAVAEFKEAFGGERRSCYFYIRVVSPWLKRLLRLRGIRV